MRARTRASRITTAAVGLVFIATTFVATATASVGAAPAPRRIGAFYTVSLHNASEKISSTGVLSGLAETSTGKITGRFIVEPPLYGGGPFSGTVTASTVEFTVRSSPNNPCDCVSLVFTGKVGAHGGMKGTYVGNTTTGSESGAWSASPHATFNCKLEAHALRKFVTTEVTYPGASMKGLLRARSRAVGSWQRFRCVAVGRDQWALQSLANGKYVRAEFGYSGAMKGILRAVSGTVGKFEKFRFKPVAACACFALVGANSRFVTDEAKDPGSTRTMLRVHAGVVGKLEEFDITST